jgi:hypothetical protein
MKTMLSHIAHLRDLYQIDEIHEREKEQFKKYTQAEIMEMIKLQT